MTEALDENLWAADEAEWDRQLKAPPPAAPDGDDAAATRRRIMVRNRVEWLEADREAREQVAAKTAGSGGELERHGWKPIDLDAVLDHAAPIVLPTMGRRNDGICLLYPGKEHAIAAEPECAKTWFILLQVADLLKRGKRVVFIDFEDDERTIVGRLKILGVLASRLRKAGNQFRYVRPEGPHEMGWLHDLLDFGDGAYADLAIYDGVTEGMQLFGLDPLSQISAAEWRRLLVKPALAVGAATFASDHVVKNRDARGRFAIGAQHKLAGLNGVQFLMEQADPFGRGLKGRSRVLVSKDRNGGLRQHGRPVEGQPGITHLGDLVGDATSGEMETLIFWPPRDENDEVAEGAGVEEVDARITLATVIRQIRAALTGKDRPQTFNDINSRVNASAAKVRSALALMEDDGELSVEDGPNRSKLHSLAGGGPVADAA